MRHRGYQKINGGICSETYKEAMSPMKLPCTVIDSHMHIKGWELSKAGDTAAKEQIENLL